jgi:Fe-S oxidoreductase
VGLEPSCVAVFRDELLNLFPHDADAKRLSQQTFLLSEFLIKEAPHYQPPALQGQALVHGHCHHKSVIGFDTEQELLARTGLTVRYPEAGCCGMAGSFGFEKDHYDVSMKVGERALLPAARQAAPDTLLISDGFSCREQVSQATGRPVLHIAEVLANVKMSESHARP